MKLKTLVPTLLIYSVCFFCCHSNHQGDPVVTDSKDKPVVVNPVNNVPEFRQGARKEAVAEYKEKTGNPLNDWYFSVKLYETQKTFYYLMKLQFEEIKGEDTLKLPDFGFAPKPVIQKGKDKYSCIVGFMDNENKFREYKLVHVVGGNNLKVTTLKRYGVATYQE